MEEEMDPARRAPTEARVKRVRVVASGRVQGVFYRAECAREARRRGVAGYVRNLSDGRVEAAFEGDDDDVTAMVEWARSGSDWAQVEDLEVHEEPPAGDPAFEISR